jgi:signal transduction histidine kinase
VVGDAVVGDAVVRHPLVGYPVERHPLVGDALVRNPLERRRMGRVGMRRPVLLVAAAHLAAATGLFALDPALRGQSGLAALFGFAAAFALVGLVPMHLDLRRHACTVVLTEAVLVLALFTLSPLTAVAAAVLGEAVSCLTARQSRLKVLFNVAATVGASSVAVAVFAAAPAHGAGEPAAWLAALAAIGCFALVNLLSTSTILAIAERRGVVGVLMASAGTAMVASAASASLGLATAVLLSTSTAGPLLLVPLLATVVLGTRRLARQSAEHLRFERLYQASSRSGRLAGFDDSLAALADESRGLLTGSVAVCLAERPDGWAGMLVDDTGSRPAGDQLRDALIALEASPAGDVVALNSLSRSQRAALPAAADLVVASSAPDSRARVVLAVFREIAPDDQGGGRAEVLSAFAGHAALTVANALLYEEVEEALRRQVDLSAQKSDFVAAVSHELRTPLTSVLASVATVRRLGDRLDAAQMERFLSTALQEGERLRRLIDELLLVAAAEHGGMVIEHKPVELAPLVRGLVADLQTKAGGRLAADLDEAAVVRTDEHKVHQILANLIENASKYAPEGTISVRVARRPGAVDLSVSDRGPGIPETDRERCFERFVQLDQSSTRRQGGTGLGLYLCRQLAELLGGEITLTGAEGGGARFTLSLPDAVRLPDTNQLLEGVA